jgi:hypothetical protein
LSAYSGNASIDFACSAVAVKRESVRVIHVIQGMRRCQLACACCCVVACCCKVQADAHAAANVSVPHNSKPLHVDCMCSPSHRK